jgi:hypothetical protein
MLHDELVDGKFADTEFLNSGGSHAQFLNSQGIDGETPIAMAPTAAPTIAIPKKETPIRAVDLEEFWRNMRLILRRRFGQALPRNSKAGFL